MATVQARLRAADRLLPYDRTEAAGLVSAGGGADAQHSLWPKGRDQPGHRPARPYRHYDMAKAGNLSLEFVAAVDVPVRTPHIRTAERDHLDAPAVAGQLTRHRLDAPAELVVIDVPGPDDACPQQSLQG